MFLAVYWSTIVLFSCTAAVENRILQFDNLNQLTSSEYDSIFGNINYLDEFNKEAEYNINVADKRGKYIRLSYKSKHPENIEIIKLDEPLHKNNIISLLCDIDSIQIRFESTKIALDYHTMIETSIDLNKAHFITGGIEWNCSNFEKNRIEPILREIIYVEMNEKGLVLDTAPAKIIDIFKDLDILFETNMDYHPTVSVYDQNHDYQSTRRRLGWLNELFSPITESINNAVTYFEGVVEDVVEIAETVTHYILGDPVNFVDKASKTWSWNYNNETTGSALYEYPFETDVVCTNCYVFMELGYYYKLTIANYVVDVIQVYIDGNVEINTDIASSTSFQKEWTQRTKKYPIPEFSFNVAGFQFGLYVYGSIGIGVHIEEAIKFAFSVNVAGYIQKGIYYDKTNGIQWYYNEQDLDYKKQGPIAEFTSGKITVYTRPTLYLELLGIGSLYFGIQPEFILDMKKTTDPECPLHYVPSIKLTYFVGVNLTIVPWLKKIELAPKQSTLENLAGCINQFEITRHQTTNSQVTYAYNSTDSVTTLPPVTTPWPSTSPTPSQSTSTPTDGAAYIDYSNINVYSNSKSIFGNASTEWWGNLSSVEDLCNDWSLSCNGFSVPIILPDEANLLMSVQDDDSLIGVYHTSIFISPSNGWNLANVSIYTYVSCTSREKFHLTYDNPDDDIKRYNIELLEWYCDTDLIQIGIDNITNPEDYNAWICMITLPSSLSAISLDKSFGSILLFEESAWCTVFTLTTKPGYVLNTTNINNINWDTFQYPSALWYGLWNCGTYNSTSIDSELHFLDFNHTTSITWALLELGEYSSYILGGWTDLDFMTMTLQFLYSWDYYNQTWQPVNWTLSFVGNLYVLYDGTMLFGGTIEGTTCTGFLFQGYINMQQFDYMDATPSPTNIPTYSPTYMPTLSPTKIPTDIPTSSPSDNPTTSPSKVPTDIPTSSPIDIPTLSPSKFPTLVPTSSPTDNPTLSPTKVPTDIPTLSPTKFPTNAPTTSTELPTRSPTELPTNIPTFSPTDVPTELPTDTPSIVPTNMPTFAQIPSYTTTVSWTTSEPIENDENENKALQSAGFSTAGGVGMFFAGMVTSFIIIGAVFIVWWFRRKKSSVVQKTVNFMNTNATNTTNTTNEEL